MIAKLKNRLLWAGLAAGIAAVLVGALTGSFVAFGLGMPAAGLCALRLAGWGPKRLAGRRNSPVSGGIAPQPLTEPVATPHDTNELVEQMIAQGRHALLLRPQVIKNLSHAQIQRAREALEASSGLVPEGEIMVGINGETYSGGEQTYEEIHARGRVYRVEAFFLDRYPVTNRQFYEFVRSGGYEQMAIWDPEIWPAVLDFVDRTGQPGPRFWSDGRYEPHKEDHPVVGVCWYEAAAYARWAGKRLPSDPEWEKAGSWPMELTATNRPQRKFPWGDSMDPSKCNIWGSGPGDTVSVYEFEDGVSVGGVYQLVGNVWEWTASRFGDPGYPSEELSLPRPMRSVRGGGYDTYFDTQATCQFQSGEDSIGRKRNIGFRCALSLRDVTLQPAEEAGPSEEANNDQAEMAGEVTA